ncbi:MAG: hypothetical protein R2709_14930 [Marmoricola sp.]
MPHRSADHGHVAACEGSEQGSDTTKNVFIEGDNLEVLKILQKH